MSFTDPNDPIRRDTTDPLNRDAIPQGTTTHNTTVVDRRSEGGMSWFIVAALVIAAGVLAYLYFGNDTNTANNAGTTTGAPADTGRASTPTTPAETESAPAASSAPSAPAGAAPSSPSSAPSTTGQ